MSAVWLNGPKQPSERLLLLAMADHADKYTGIAWPSTTTLAEKASMTTRNVSRALESLKIAGWLRNLPRTHERGGHTYKLNLPKLNYFGPPASPDKLSGHRKPSADKMSSQDAEVDQTFSSVGQTNQTSRPDISNIVNNIVFKRHEPLIEPSVSNTLAPSDKKHRSMPEVMTFFDLPLIGGKEYGVPQKLYDEYLKAYTGVSVMAELGNMRVWLLSNPTKMKTLTGMTRFMNSWLARAQDKERHGKSSYGNLPRGKADANVVVFAESIGRGQREGGAYENGRLSTGGNGHDNSQRIRTSFTVGRPLGCGLASALSALPRAEG